MSSEVLYSLAELVHFILDLLVCCLFFPHHYHFSLLTTLCICHSIKGRPIFSLLNTFPSFIFSISLHFSFLSLHFLLWFLDIKSICEHVLVSWQDIYFLSTVYISVSLSTLFIFIFLILVSFSYSGKVCCHFPPRPPTFIFPCNISFLSLQLKTWFLWQLSIMVPCHQPNVGAWLTSGQS